MKDKKTQDDTAARLAAAREYVNRQLATMQGYGSAPKNLSSEDYEKLVEEVAHATR